jgi:type I restriction enzyme, S subunit
MSGNGDRPELPEGWEWKTLGEVAKTSSGGTPLRSRPDYFGGDVPWLKIADLNDSIVSEASEGITELGLAESSARLLDKGTLLIAMYGSIGKLGILGIRAATNQAICAIQPRQDIVTRDFLFWFLRSQRKSLLAAGYGGTQANISQRFLKGLPVPVPPREIQDQIVGRCESLWSALNDADGFLAQAERQAWAYEVSSLDAVLNQREKPGWEWSPVGDIGSVQLGRQRAPRYHEGSHMRPYLRVANVFDDRLELSDVMEMDFPPADFEKYELKPGDILLNEGQSPHLLGRPAMYRGELPGACFTNTLLRFRPGERIRGDFALLVFRHFMYSGRFMREARITTNIAHLSAKRFSAIEFPVPPLAEQERIVADANVRIQLGRALAQEVQSARQRSEQLRSASLISVFTGDETKADGLRRAVG